MMPTKMLFLVLLLPTICLSSSNYRRNLKTYAEWKELKFNFPTRTAKAAALRDGLYVPGNSIPSGVDVWYKDSKNRKVFVGVARFKNGVPITLGYLSTKEGKGGPKLQPYPDYSWHSSNGTDCDGLTSVFRIFVDKCKRLWALDTGRIGRDQLCPPQILAFDLETDKLVHRYRIPSSQYTPGVSIFGTVVVDVRDPSHKSCKNAVVYMTDAGANGLVVYDLSCGESWRFENKLMNTVPKFENFTISGQSYVLKIGLSGLAFSPNHIPQSERLLYFHALAAETENTVPLSFLTNKKNWIPNPNTYHQVFKTIGSRGVQSIAEAMDQYGNLFFGICGPNAIVCWDSSKPYIKCNLKIAVQNDLTLRFAAALKIITKPRAKFGLGEQELWVLTNNYPKFITNSLTSDEVNFRILYSSTEKLLDGTKCVGKSLE